MLAKKQAACSAGTGLDSCENSLKLPPPEYTVGSDGWWKPADVSRATAPSLPSCSIPRVQTLTAAEFDKIYRGTTPVIVEDGASNWAALNTWTPSYLETQFGVRKIGYGGSLALIRQGGDVTTTVSFGQFLNISREYATKNEGGEGGEYPYLFDRKILSETTSLENDYAAPYFLSSIDWMAHRNSKDDDDGGGSGGGSNDTVKVQQQGGLEYFLSVGNSQTGTVLHQHFEAFNAVIVGSKKWFVFPPHVVPAIEYPPHRTIRKWVSEVYEPALAGNSRLAPLECTVAPGEVLYIPAGWFHATINLGETVSVSKQHRPSMDGIDPPTDDSLQSCTTGNCVNDRYEAAPKWLWCKQKLEAVLNGAFPDVKPDEAIALARTLVHIRPLSSEAFVLYAHVMSELGKFGAAVDAARKAVSLDSTAAGGHFELVDVALRALQAHTTQLMLETDEQTPPIAVHGQQSKPTVEHGDGGDAFPPDILQQIKEMEEMEEGGQPAMKVELRKGTWYILVFCILHLFISPPFPVGLW